MSDALIAENGNLLEYSVVYTDRALNHMSAPFQQVMLDLHSSLTKAYNCEHLVMLPGSGTYAMEAAARAFGDGEVVVIRNGYFSYRWSQLFDCARTASRFGFASRFSLGFSSRFETRVEISDFTMRSIELVRSVALPELTISRPNRTQSGRDTTRETKSPHVVACRHGQGPRHRAREQRPRDKV